MKAKVYCAFLSLKTLGAGVHDQMFRSSGQYDAKPTTFSSQASLVLIYRPIEGIDHLKMRNVIEQALLVFLLGQVRTISELGRVTAHEGQDLLCLSQFT
ncbi:hypothetical protein TNCV_4459611 [Trichonephila clavipes]|nr:hypothetical protein TNCV_4459611 [Trichonephila clavipes]